MRSFNYFLYDHYDAQRIKSPFDDPRKVLTQSADDVLTKIVEIEPGKCRYEQLCSDSSAEVVDNLIHVGLLRKDEDIVVLDSPVFVNEDAVHLHLCFARNVDRMFQILQQRQTEFYRLAGNINNGFSAQLNLYHMLCGSIFDGAFFEYISRCNLVSTSRLHRSGLDYLIIAYEKAAALDRLSKKLLCSYNRFSDGTRAFQSFGDADGNRVDFFRFMRQKTLGKVPITLKNIEVIWDSLDSENMKSKLLDEMQRFLQTGSCDERCYQLMSLFGYIQSGRIAVPVYRKEHKPVFDALEQLTEECIYGEIEAALSTPEIISGLLCSKHKVSTKEIANELYHIIFGQLNELLVASGFVAGPKWSAGEGRYLQSIEIM